MKVNLLKAFLLFTLSLLSGMEAWATKYYWVGGGANANWNNANNWSNTPGGTGGFGVPANRNNSTTPVTLGDSVYFTTGSAPCNINTGVNLETFEINGYSGTITQGNVNVTITDFTMSSGVFVGSTSNNRNITLRGNFTQTGGSFTASKGELNFTANDKTHTFNGTFLHNDNLLTTFSGNCAIFGNPAFRNLEFAASGKRIFEIANTIEVTNDFKMSGTGSIYINTNTTTNSGTIALRNTANLTSVNTGTAGGGTALIRFEGTGNQNLYGATAVNESRLPRVQINKTSGTVAFHNTITLTNEFTNTSNSVDATTNFPKVIFINGNSGLTGGAINSYDITGSTTFYDLEFATTVNTEFNIASGTTLTANNNFYISGANRATINGGTVDLKGNMYATNTSTSGGVSTGVIKFSGTGTQNLYGSAIAGESQLPKLEITKPSGTLNFHNVINLKGGLVESGNGQIDDSNAIMAVNGTMTIESITNQLSLNHLLIPGTAATNLTSNVTNSLQVNKLEINGSSNVSLNTSLIGSQNLFIKVSGDLINTNTSTSNGGGSVTMLLNGTGTQNFTGGTVAGGGKLPGITIDKPSGTVNLSENISLSNGSNWTLTNGALAAGNSTLVFANSGSVISGTQTLNNLTFAPSTAATHNYTVANGSVTVNGNLTFDGQSGANLTLASGTIDTKQDLIINNGSLSNGGSGVIRLSGTTNQQILSNAAAGIPNLTISKASGNVSVSSNLNVRGTLAMDNANIDMLGNTLTLGTGTSLANRGTLDFTSGKIYNGTFGRWYGTGGVAAGSNAALFPLASTANDRSLYISTSSSSGGIIAVQHDENAAAASADINDNSTLIKSYLPSAWNISTTGVTSGTFNMQISAEGLSPINNLNDVRLVKTGSAVGTHGTVSGTTSDATLTRTGITATDLSGTFRIGSTDPIDPLPVALVSFRAEKTENKVNLIWKTASEKNNDFFTVERSANGRTFEAIGQVKGAGNSNALITYAFEDKNPVTGVSYYRLKQTDFDGQFEYSKIVSVTFEGKTTPVILSVYPNPAVNVVNVKTNGLSGKATLNITDLSGRTVKQIQVNAAETTGINVENLPKGLYQIQVISENGTTVSKFLKQ